MEKETHSPPPEEKATGQPFDKAALSRMRETAQTVIAAHPEIRSVIVVMDYKGALNDAKVDRAVWIGDQGPVTAVDGLFGSLSSMLRVLELMFQRIVVKENELKDQIVVIGNELTKRRNDATSNTEKTATGIPDKHRVVLYGLDNIHTWPDKVWIDEEGGSHICNESGTLLSEQFDLARFVAEGYRSVGTWRTHEETFRTRWERIHPPVRRDDAGSPATT